jgi:hypothetical protein
MIPKEQRWRNQRFQMMLTETDRRVRVYEETLGRDPQLLHLDHKSSLDPLDHF